ncbi:hypothetical protein BJ170DRAFT_686824 [Xylariales sp. AK1849]|nr:hypothetical protein BJ170DRAFT_686824 [Xylariales sp. AK1849]
MPFCAICGGPLREPFPIDGVEWSDDLKWQTKAVMLSDPATEFDTLEMHYRGGKKKEIEQLTRTFDADIRRDRAIATGLGTYVLMDTAQELAPNWMAVFDENGDPYSIYYAIVTHEACVDIAMKVMRYSQVGVHVQSLRTLWKVLRTRWDARDSEYMGSVAFSGPHHVVMNHGYYTPLNSSVGEYSMWQGFITHWVVADPLKIPNLTAHILSNLETLESEPGNPAAKTFRRCFLTLPPELQERVVESMGSSDGLPMQCNHLLPQEAWRDIFLGRRFLPFLWDLDYAVIEKYCEDMANNGFELNWELLVRKLSKGIGEDIPGGTAETQPNFQCYPDLEIPKGMRNRRRIWQLVEEMYVGDVLPTVRSWMALDEKPTMPRYWDEYGKQVYPIVRVGGHP